MALGAHSPAGPAPGQAAHGLFSLPLSCFLPLSFSSSLLFCFYFILDTPLLIHIFLRLPSTKSLTKVIKILGSIQQKHTHTVHTHVCTDIFVHPVFTKVAPTIQVSELYLKCNECVRQLWQPQCYQNMTRLTVNVACGSLCPWNTHPHKELGPNLVYKLTQSLI